ncbi:MAG TPA: SIMPL domain-containing protein [Gemmataceae bacterium]|jgi:uncharacterized protein YggE|nr:SIMPL domain-containing protein [Gemmataceae bacterium]
MRLSLVAALLVAAGPAVAQPAKERVISVTGTATVYAQPDTARIHYGARLSEPAVDAVKDSLGKTTKAMDEAVKKLNLSSEVLRISPAPVTIRQVQANANGLPMAPGAPAAPAPGIGPFSANAAYCATITDKDPAKLRAAVEAFVRAVTEAGANTPGDDKDSQLNVFVGNQETTSGPKVVLTRSDDSAARADALQKAVERAMKDARAIAKALGGGDPTVLSVTEGDSIPAPTNQDTLSMIYGMEAGGARAPAGEIEVRVKVTLKCSY